MDLSAVWDEGKRGRDQFRQSCETRVVEWVWDTVGSEWDRRPFAAERMGAPRGRRLEHPPDELAHVTQLGYDEQRSLAVAYHYAAPGSFSRDFYVSAGDCLRRYSYDERGELSSVAVYGYRGGRMTFSESYSLYSGLAWGREIYHYVGERLDRIVSHQFSSVDIESERTGDVSTWVELLDYGDGELTGIAAVPQKPGERPTTLYRRPGTPLDTLLKTVETELVSAIPRAIALAQVDGPVWALALVYDPDAPLPPTLFLGAARERREWGVDADLLNPAEWTVIGNIELPADELGIARVCAELNDALRASGQPEATKTLLNSVARHLIEIDWSSIVQTSDDFIAYAVDPELLDLDENLRLGLGQARYELLRAQGII